ncbi:MAG: hypothetical protein K2J65_00210 [Duncaniella sp.]|nr:hypothetical protein [Duncaniella sp.]MDE6858822.1 hypothetical protein [Duncaniella sp.]MDE7146172.1 hypothetical protein [Duncaniella sp.]
MKQKHHTDRQTPDTTKRTALSNILSTVGLLAIMVAALFPLLKIAMGANRYIYAAGAVILLAGKLIAPALKDAPLRLRRLVRMEVWAALIFVVGAVFMFLPGTDWIAFTLAGGLLTIYTSIMIPRQKIKAEEK